MSFDEDCCANDVNVDCCFITVGLVDDDDGDDKADFFRSFTKLIFGATVEDLDIISVNTFGLF